MGFPAVLPTCVRRDERKDSGILHSDIKDCETMRMVSSYWLSRNEDCEPMRMVTACPYAGTEDWHTMRMTSSYRLTITEDYIWLVPKNLWRSPFGQCSYRSSFPHWKAIWKATEGMQSKSSQTPPHVCAPELEA